VTFAGLAGTGAGIMNLLGSRSTFTVQGAQTLSNLVINIGNNTLFYSDLARR